MIYNEQEVARKVNNWNRALPWIKLHFAVKSSPSMPILTDLHTHGCGFDCASRNEIEKVLGMGVSRELIVFSNSVKDESELAWAGQNGIQLTTADTIDELKKIRKLAPNMSILWRIAIEEEASDNLSTVFSGKFGDDLNSSQEIHQRME